MTPDEARQIFERDRATGNIAHGNCQFCEGEILFPRKVVNGFPYVMHSMPYCKTYDRLDALAFMEASFKRLKGEVS